MDGTSNPSIRSFFEAAQDFIRHNASVPPHEIKSHLALSTEVTGESAKTGRYFQIQFRCLAVVEICALLQVA